MKKIFKKNQVIITALAIMIMVAGYLNFSEDNQMLNTSVENMESEGASGNSDDDMISAAVEDTVEGEEYAQENAIGETGDDVVETDASATGENAETREGETADTTQEVVYDENGNVVTTETEGEELAEASLDENGDPIDSESVGEAVLTNASVTLSQAKLNREQVRAKAKEMLLEIINNENLSEESKKEAVSKMIEMTEQMEKESAAETQLAAKGYTDAVVSISEGCVDVTLSVTELEDGERAQIEDIIMRKTGCELQDIVITTTNS
ncbi:MAG: SpoIIIAH-like family protein [Lachnospiraceae bacterium]|nr:SpoIIIAH-like family protein [Lachnospiraceae bacterium]